MLLNKIHRFILKLSVQPIPIVSMVCILELDQPTAELIIQIQLQDASSFSNTLKGKSRDPTDEELAFYLQKEQLEAVSLTCSQG